ncbi:MAG: hypothetical protein ABSE97_03195 [Verrucomicrobiota bacterium]|jgi:hypothetical protein
MNAKTPAIVFLVLGIIFIVFSKLILVGFKWLEKKIWNEERRKQFPAYGSKSRDYKPWMVVVLGVSWIACAIFFWFTSR